MQEGAEIVPEVGRKEAKRGWNPTGRGGAEMGRGDGFAGRVELYKIGIM